MTITLPLPAEMTAPLRWSRVQRLLGCCIDLGVRGALPLSLMVVGEEGLGREAVAVELAASLICRNPYPPHQDCPVCDRVRRGIHPDLELVGVADDKSKISIEQIRTAVDSLPRHPFEGRGRVILLACAHTPPLGQEAASALLKGLEEPPPHVTFLLLAANPIRVLPTIVSRTVQIRVPAPLPEEAAVHVAEVTGLELHSARALLAALAGDTALAVRQDRGTGADVLAGVLPSLDAAVSGDGPAIVHAAALAATVTGGVETIVATLIASAAAADAQGAECRLRAAAALLRADSRRRALNLPDAEAVFAGALARAVTAFPER